ncbi:MAG TPA: phosphate ABC transporter substrate-binding protein PstS [Xanthobacteraceae bacterium]
MKILYAFAAAGVVAGAVLAPAVAAEVSGAGATFPYPIYAKWAEAYKKATGIAVSYQSIGSGDGIRQIQSKEVTFGATDMPLSVGDLDADALVQFPTVMGGIAVVVNIAGVKTGDLVLDGPTIAKIFLGEIRSWNDAAIRKLNPNLKLPSQAITVMHRSDGSGTTFAFTNYLTKVSADWRSKVGSITSVDWPVGIGAGGNQGVADAVARTKGAIGYVEYAYAKQGKLSSAKLINKDSKTVAPGAQSFMAAAGNANWEATPGFGVILTNESGAETWPITSASFVLVHKQPDDPAAVRAALKFFDWAYAKGAGMAGELDYVPLPGNVVAAVRKLWAAQITDARGRPIYPLSK